ncbi:popeye domain-containing protein 3 [Pygocentrus nattereri]|uniref:POPDC1-3 domain-containing protein n=1 Tax=Pygocentrus nattereri TaxID=42514 RepID=A0A3B4E3F0_PYGNA|nr:popeye domain-containing protein 3 [Pygocentrus nattereri]
MTMDPPSLSGRANYSVSDQPLCSEWQKAPEGAVFHLAHILLVLGFMGGSGFYGLLYMFSFLALGFLCCCLHGWSEPCAPDASAWPCALSVLCVAQALHVAHRARSVAFGGELQELYARMFNKLGVSLTHYGEIVACCEGQIQTMEKDHFFSIEGKTPIDKLSVLLSGRVRVSVNGEFLHYIHPFQFLDSPEWDSLRPSEDGVFQVTLRADSRCRYVTWRRKKLYLLFAQHRYIARIFALLVRNDIADKLFSLNTAALDGRGFRYDLRLPSFCHGPHLERTGAIPPLRPSRNRNKRVITKPVDSKS